ncbi:MAG: hypothetical protein ACLGI6_07875 [Gammaproteobacteria bacterium]
MTHHQRILARALAHALFVLAAGAAHAQAPAPAFAHIFSDHAVLQRGEPLTVWGSAAPSQQVTLSLNGASASVSADAHGKWRATLPAMTAGGPYTLTASAGGASATLKDVMVGDVFLCSGQSNMAFPVRLEAGA